MLHTVAVRWSQLSANGILADREERFFSRSAAVANRLAREFVQRLHRRHDVALEVPFWEISQVQGGRAVWSYGRTWYATFHHNTPDSVLAWVRHLAYWYLPDFNRQVQGRYAA